MTIVLILLAVLVFYWYYKTWGKHDFLDSASRGAKGFISGIMQERIDEVKRRMNYYVIALLAKIAKSDGRVSEQEADMISQLLDANASNIQEREFLKASFNEHKENINNAFYVAKDFLKEVPLPRAQRLNVLRVLVFMALIDGQFNVKKQEILDEIARAFELEKSELDSFIESLSNLKRSQQGMSVEKAYELLELPNNADLSTVKKRYRVLAKKYHPDILNANNVSKEELEQGVTKFQKINEAYEIIKKHLEK
ncbi:molecular chaperone DjiA [Campylobacter sp. MIT 21-1685]|uniref:molecular chaperone DjiA n=1 Tax=unclassified Campylobacter TaxID=2593542 RepID=UPI00224A4933|nr:MULTISPECIES: molecular chaperone DjiA [unclassified Campylobacter]MCX2683091.1 molecular chaperone DjiA [Campylobacter sp. MIT 21-1684]MCX2751449.1 molecular chaperone DjiA [Campylobacter sp. MIT 21-1682]MCX2807649.1 molecular chaperone DjiA [Campylobacter sp. MIT 21-1685]